MTTVEALHLAADAAWPDPTPRLVLADHYEDTGDRVEAALQRVLAEPLSDERRLEYADALERVEAVECPVCLGTGSVNMGLAEAFCTTCSGRIWVPGGGYWRGSGTVCPRAEFIRVQVEIATRNPEPTLPSNRQELEELRRREIEAWDAGDWEEWKRLPGHAFNTLGRLGANLVSSVLPVARWSRGFVEKVICPWGSWREHGPTLVRRHPVTRVVLVGRVPEAAYGGYGWRDEGELNGPENIPSVILSLGTTHHIFDTQELALDALSNACLAWAWKQSA